MNVHGVQDDVVLVRLGREELTQPRSLDSDALAWGPLTVGQPPRLLGVTEVLEILTGQSPIPAEDVSDGVECRLVELPGIAGRVPLSFLVPQRADDGPHVPRGDRLMEEREPEDSEVMPLRVVEQLVKLLDGESRRPLAHGRGDVMCRHLYPSTRLVARRISAHPEPPPLERLFDILRIISAIVEPGAPMRAALCDLLGGLQDAKHVAAREPAQLVVAPAPSTP